MCHRSLPIDRYNQYQSNQIYRFLSIDYFGYTKIVAHKPITTLRRLLSQCFGGREIGFLFNC